MQPDEMAAIHAAAFTQSRPWCVEDFATLLDQPTVFACYNDHAFAVARVVADEAELLTLATHPAAQRRGHARALMETWQTIAKGRGARRAFLEVASDNPVAHQLYVSCGFNQTGLRKGYYPRAGIQPADALIMHRDLTPS